MRVFGGEDRLEALLDNLNEAVFKKDSTRIIYQEAAEEQQPLQ